jgi:hypothetical protein
MPLQPGASGPGLGSLNAMPGLARRQLYDGWVEFTEIHLARSIGLSRCQCEDSIAGDALLDGCAWRQAIK